MEKVNDFLSSSTIHGLAYIPTSRGLLRLFWVLVVVSGFSTAAYLIVKSFRGWQESPISTSIEVLPITEMTFPNVTVCPPRDSLTLLNYDLQRAADVNVSREEREELSKYISELFLQEGYEAMLKDVKVFYERDRFRHWYEGVSQISLSYWQDIDKQKYFNFKTYATSGEIATPYYGEPWEAEKFEQSVSYSVNIYQPWAETGGHDNVSLTFTVHQDIMTELDGLGAVTDFDYSSVNGNGNLDRTIRNLTILKPRNFHPSHYHFVGLGRKVSVQKLSSLSRDILPGMRVSWQYNDTVKTDRNYLADNRNFILLANIVLMSGDKDEVWELVKETRGELMRAKTDKDCKKNMFVAEERLAENIGALGRRLKLNVTSTPVGNISEEVLNTAAEFYIYLIFCPTDKLKTWQEFYVSMLARGLKTLLLTLNGIISKHKLLSRLEYRLASKILDKIITVFDLKIKDIEFIVRNHQMEEYETPVKQSVLKVVGKQSVL